jgi:hypothetical protein
VGPLEKEDRRILAPSNLFYDVTNILSTYLRQGILSPRTVQSILQACRALPIHLVMKPNCMCGHFNYQNDITCHWDAIPITWHWLKSWIKNYGRMTTVWL